MREINKGLYQNPEFSRKAKETRIADTDRLERLRSAYNQIIEERRSKTNGPLQENDYLITSDDINNAHKKGLCDSSSVLHQKFGTIGHACFEANIPFGRKINNKLVRIVEE